jgi:hypothetical protein
MTEMSASGAPRWLRPYCAPVFGLAESALVQYKGSTRQETEDSVALRRPVN